MTITVSIFSALASIIAAIISAIAAVMVAKINARQEKQNKEINEHNKRREQEAILSGKMVAALCGLSEVTAEAVRGGYTNGNLEAAQKAAEKAEQEYEDFLKQIALTDLTN